MRYFFGSVFNFILLLVFVSCGKNDPLDCDFNVTPYIEIEQGAYQYIDSSVVGYLFYADSVDYKVNSYEEAAEGIVVSKSDGSALGYHERVELNRYGSILFPNITQASVMLVLVESDHRIYAWRPLYLEPGIGFLTTRLRFRPWRGERYNESGWTVIPQPLPDEDDNEEEGE